MSLILIVEDDPQIKRLIEFHVAAERLDFVSAETVSAGLRLIRSRRPDLVILDIMLPDMSGMELLKTAKNDPAIANVPILILSAKSEEMDKVIGLELGAEDYVTKPFSPRELMLRIKKILKRATSNEAKPKQIQFKELSISPADLVATLSGKRLDLTATEFDLLSYLVMNKGRLCSRETILNKVWGYSSDVYSRTVDAHISRLREKLGGYGKYIHNVRGVGYRWEEK